MTKTIIVEKNMPKKGKIEEKRTAMKRVSAIVKPQELSLEDWQARIRKQAAFDECFSVKNTGNHPVFTTYQVSNAKTNNVYRVEIRGEVAGINYCSCPDYSLNTLGTCKHIEYVLNLIRGNSKLRKILEKGYIPDHSSVTLRYGLDRKIVFSLGTEASNSLKILVQRYFDKNGILLERGLDRFDEFVRFAGALEDKVHYHEDAMTYIANMRDIKSRKKRIEKMLPAGANDKIFDTLLKTELYQYQKEGAFFAVQAGRCLIADEMGLGKTIQAIAASELMARCFGIKKVLIICPTSLKHQWESEIDKFAKQQAQVIKGISAVRQDQYKVESFFKITSYNVIHRDFCAIEEWSPDLIILDEAQRIKNWKTRLAKTVKKLYSPYAIVLTGTPLENRLEELHSIVEFIDRYRLGPLFRFLHNHQLTDDGGKVVGYRNLNELGKSLETVLIRRKGQEVLAQLPKRLEKNYFVPMTQGQNEIHEENSGIVARIVNKWRKYKFLSEIDKQRLMIALQYMRMASDDTYLINQDKQSGNKIKELEIQLEELLEYKDTKVVIFSQWIKMIELIVKMLESRQWKYVWLHGGVPGDKRGELIKTFKIDADCRIFLSTETGGVGLNLQNASAVINVDLPWNPAVLEQRIARVHRLGQRNTVRVINLIAENSIEHGMLSLIKFKKSMFLGVLDGGEDKVFMGKSRFNQFMQTVETAAESTSAAKVTQKEMAEALEDTRTANEEIPDDNIRETPDGQDVITSASLGDIFKKGALFLEQLSKQFNGKEQRDEKSSGIRVFKEEKTGKQMLQLPMPDNATIEKLIQTGQAVFSMLIKGIKDGNQ